jgi:hypothetical protein
MRRYERRPSADPNVAPMVRCRTASTTQAGRPRSTEVWAAARARTSGQRCSARRRVAGQPLRAQPAHAWREGPPWYTSATFWSQSNTTVGARHQADAPPATRRRGANTFSASPLRLAVLSVARLLGSRTGASLLAVFGARLWFAQPVRRRGSAGAGGRRPSTRSGTPGSRRPLHGGRACDGGTSSRRGSRPSISPTFGRGNTQAVRHPGQRTALNDDRCEPSYDADTGRPLRTGSRFRDEPGSLGAPGFCAAYRAGRSRPVR